MGRRVGWRYFVHLIEIANSQEDRIHIELINGSFLYTSKGSPAECGAGLKLAIGRGWLWLHERGTYVKFTQAGAELFVWKGVHCTISVISWEALRYPIDSGIRYPCHSGLGSHIHAGQLFGCPIRPHGLDDITRAVVQLAHR